MDKKKSILNVTVSLACKIVTMILVIFVKRVLIQTCGNEVNGLNALYISVIDFLAVAELGVGTAISFCMYKPLVEGNHQQVSALYHLFCRLYLLIGGFILIAGLAITPFIRFLAKDYAELDVNMYSTFVLMLISVVITYFFGSKTSLINAYKNNYITTAITSGGTVLQYVMQIVVLLQTGSYVGYLMCRIVTALLQWLVTEIVTRRGYSKIIKQKHSVDEETKHALVRSVRAMFMHNIGGFVFNAVDSIVISTCIGVIALGVYSNYVLILNSMASVLCIGFASLTSVVGHLHVQEKKETTQNYHESFHKINFAIGCIFYLGYYAIADELIILLFSGELVCARSVVFVITLNGFIQFMRRSTLIFREATGTFYNDRWKPLFEGATNIVLSVFLVNRFGVAGVIVATIVTNLLICHVVEPYVLYKHAFSSSPTRYYLRNYAYIGAFVGGMLLLQYLMVQHEQESIRLLVNGCISIGVSAIICSVTMFILRKKTVSIKSLFKKENNA